MFRRLLLIVILSIVATSCYSLDTTLVVNDDGSGTFSLDYLIDKDTSSETLQTGGDILSPCSALAEIEAAAPAGSTVVPLETGSQCGAHLEMAFANPDELSAGVRQLVEAGRFSAFGYFPEVTVQPSGAEGGWKFDAKFKPPVPINLDTQGQFRKDVGAGTFSFGVKLPGRQVEHNADRITSDGTMIFEIDPIVGGSGQLLVITEPGVTILGGPEPSSLPSVKILVGIALFALLIAGFGVHQQKKKRQYEGDPDDDSGMIAIGERLGLTLSEPDPVDDAAPSLDEAESSLAPPESSLALPASSLPAPESSLAPPESSLEAPESSLAPPTAPDLSNNAPEMVAAAAEEWPSATPAQSSGPVLDTDPASQQKDDSAEASGWITSVHAVDTAPAADQVVETVEPVADIDSVPTEITEAGPVPVSASADAAVGVESTASTWPATAAGIVSAPWPTGPAPTSSSQAVGANAAGAWPVGPGAGEPEPAVTPESVKEPTEPSQSAPTQDEMVWDQDRGAYVVFDPRRQAWMVFD
ncbi:MAG: hypothetical protein V3V01_18715, partial [Acidimicrobiales bacterium]